MRDEDIVAAARAVRAELPELWARAGGARVAAADTLLERAAAGERVGDEILTLLTADGAMRGELARRLRPEEDTYREVSGAPGYAALPGHGDPSAEIVYGCAVCGYAYPIFEVGEPVPDGCPDGHGPLERVV